MDSIAKSHKNPPAMGVEKDYQTWRNEIEMWQLGTDLEKKKQAVALSVTGSYREVAMEVPKDDLNKDNGMETLLTKMDALSNEKRPMKPMIHIFKRETMKPMIHMRSLKTSAVKELRILTILSSVSKEPIIAPRSTA